MGCVTRRSNVASTARRIRSGESEPRSIRSMRSSRSRTRRLAAPAGAAAALPSCSHLLDYAVEPLPCSPARVHLHELTCHHESSLKRFSKRLDLQAPCWTAPVNNDAKERA